MKVFIFLYCELNIDNDNCQMNIAIGNIVVVVN